MKRLAITIKWGTPTAAKAEDNKQIHNGDGLRKAAILMTLLGDDTTKEIYKHLNYDERIQLTREITELGEISPEYALEVLREYSRLTGSQVKTSQQSFEVSAKKSEEDGKVVLRRRSREDGLV